MDVATVRMMRSSSLLMRRLISSRRRSNTASSFCSSQAGQRLNKRNRSSTSPSSGSPVAARCKVLFDMLSETPFPLGLPVVRRLETRSEDARRPLAFRHGHATAAAGRSSTCRPLSHGLSKGPKVSVTSQASKKRPRFSAGGAYRGPSAL